MQICRHVLAVAALVLVLASCGDSPGSPDGAIDGHGADTSSIVGVGFDQPASSGDELASPPGFVVSMTATSTDEVTVEYSVTGGTATADTDFVLPAGTLTFAPGETSKAVPMLLEDDALDEESETVVLTISAPVGATLEAQTTHTFSIIDNDPEPTVGFQSASSTVGEMDTPANVSVILAVASGKPVSVTYGVTGGSATGGGTDFSFSDGVLTFAPGETQMMLTPAIVNDAVDEADETIVLTLSGASNADLATASHTVTIQNDDAVPIVELVVTPPGSGMESVSPTINVQISKAWPSAITVQVAATGTATAGQDYNLTPTTITFPANSTANQPVPLTILDDDRDEDDQTVILTLSSPVNATLGGRSQHTYTILDNDGPPTVSFSVATLAGPESIASPGITAMLSTASEKVVTVDYSATGGTATANTDYTLAAGSATFAPLDVVETIPLAVTTDSTVEPSETVVITLASPNNATLTAPITHTYTITDSSVTIQFMTASTSASESTGGVVTRTASVTLSAVNNFNSVTVQVTAADGSATANSDYVFVPSVQTLTFTPGQSTGMVSWSIIGDTTAEANENFTLTLSSPTHARLGTTIVHTHTIINDDP